MAARRVVLVFGLAFLPSAGSAQTFTYRGFVEARPIFYPQEAPNDRVRLVTDLLARGEAFVKPSSWLQVAGGVDVRLNTHDQVQGSWRVDFRDRQPLRQAVSVRRLSATLTRGALTVDAGKQVIRWGKTDIVTPTDRFAPRDFVNVIDSDFLGVAGARAVLQLRTHTLDVVAVPSFTPSRLPLVNQRWTVRPAAAPQIPVQQAGGPFPDRWQAGIRWGHVGTGSTAAEYSLAFFDGFNHLPDFEVVPARQPLGFSLIRRYPALRMYGGDLAWPNRWFTLKAEAGYFTSSTAGADEYVLYVVQVERQSGEWFLVGGYAGEAVTADRTALAFVPDRGLTRSLVGRATYTIDVNRSLAVEGAVRQNGRGAFAKAEYSQAYGQHWRATLYGAAIGGDEADFLGQYRRNSHVALALRFSF